MSFHQNIVKISFKAITMAKQELMHISLPSLATNHKIVQFSLTVTAILEAILDLYFSIQ